jgi:hypothetical protein
VVKLRWYPADLRVSAELSICRRAPNVRSVPLAIGQMFRRTHQANPQFSLFLDKICQCQCVTSEHAPFLFVGGSALETSEYRSYPPCVAPLSFRRYDAYTRVPRRADMGARNPFLLCARSGRRRLGYSRSRETPPEAILRRKQDSFITRLIFCCRFVTFC